MPMNEEQIRKDLAERVVRLGDELDKMIKLVTFSREALQNEMFGDGGFAKTELRPSYVAKMRSLTSMIDMLVSSKIRWDKNQALMAKAMTPAEEKKAVREYIRALPLNDRYDFIRDEMRWHQARLAETHPNQVKGNGNPVSGE